MRVRLCRAERGRLVLAGGWVVGYWHYGCPPRGSTDPVAWGAHLFCPVPLPGVLSPVHIDGYARREDLRRAITATLTDLGWDDAINLWRRS